MTDQATSAPPSPEAIAKQLEAADQAMRQAEKIIGARDQQEQLQAQVADLRVKIGDLEVRRDEIARQRAEAKPADRALYDKQWADVQHDYNVVQGQLLVVNSKMADLQHARDMMQAREAQQVMTVPPPMPDPFDAAQLRGIEIGGFILLIPLVLAFARRIWVRSGPRAASFDFDSSPRLQRMEQAIESIAIEVERIGEAQRFTTKLLSERQPDAVAGRIPSAQTARREPGTITPH
jgi:hypothetical protein